MANDIVYDMWRSNNPDGVWINPRVTTEELAAALGFKGVDVINLKPFSYGKEIGFTVGFAADHPKTVEWRRIINESPECAEALKAYEARDKNADSSELREQLLQARANASAAAGFSWSDEAK